MPPVGRCRRSAGAGVDRASGVVGAGVVVAGGAAASSSGRRRASVADVVESPGSAAPCWPHSSKPKARRGGLGVALRPASSSTSSGVGGGRVAAGQRALLLLERRDLVLDRRVEVGERAVGILGLAERLQAARAVCLVMLELLLESRSSCRPASVERLAIAAFASAQRASAAVMNSSVETAGRSPRVGRRRRRPTGSSSRRPPQPAITPRREDRERARACSRVATLPSHLQGGQR